MFWQWLRKNHRLASKQRPVLWDIEVVQFILAKISELGVASYGYKQAFRQFFWSQNKTDLIRHPLLRARRKDMRSPNCVSTRKDFSTPEEFERIRKSPKMLPDEIITMELHATLGCREGKPLVNPNASLLGINWGRYNREVKTIDVWEPKTGGGTWWRDIPLDLFFRDLPAKLETLWLSLDKPSEGRILPWSYEQLRGIYKKASKILGRKINPHDARRSHATWLLDADCDVRAIIGEYNPQRGEGRALGVGWENPEIFFRRYGRLSKKKRVQEIEKVRSMYWA